LGFLLGLVDFFIEVLADVIDSLCEVVAQSGQCDAENFTDLFDGGFDFVGGVDGLFLDSWAVLEDLLVELGVF
jgi:hypothetical protein